jgi:hypothetical protein
MKSKRCFTGDRGELNDPLLRPLFNDVNECDDVLEKSDTQFARRSLIRAAFAYHEGCIYWLKQHVKNWLIKMGMKNNNIEIVKLLLLDDSSFKPDQNGKIVEEPLRISFRNDCAFVLRTAAECGGHDPVKLFSDNGWREMQVALDVRHRITHPKKPEDLDITDSELDSLRESFRWFYNCMVDILNTAIGKARTPYGA